MISCFVLSRVLFHRYALRVVVLVVYWSIEVRLRCTTRKCCRKSVLHKGEIKVWRRKPSWAPTLIIIEKWAATSDLLSVVELT